MPAELGTLQFMITYGCPTCRTELTKPPIENYCINSIIEAVGDQNEGVPAIQMESQRGDPDDIPLDELLKHLE